jgi:hypothetical protein
LRPQIRKMDSIPTALRLLPDVRLGCASVWRSAPCKLFKPLSVIRPRNKAWRGISGHYWPRLINFHGRRLGCPAVMLSEASARSMSSGGSRVPVAMRALFEAMTLPLGPSRTTAGSRIWRARRKTFSSFTSGRSHPRTCVPCAVGAGTQRVMMLTLMPPKST